MRTVLNVSLVLALAVGVLAQDQGEPATLEQAKDEIARLRLELAKANAEIARLKQELAKHGEAADAENLEADKLKKAAESTLVIEVRDVADLLNRLPDSARGPKKGQAWSAQHLAAANAWLKEHLVGKKFKITEQFWEASDNNILACMRNTGFWYSRPMMRIVLKSTYPASDAPYVAELKRGQPVTQVGVLSKLELTRVTADGGIVVAELSHAQIVKP